MSLPPTVSDQGKKRREADLPNPQPQPRAGLPNSSQQQEAEDSDLEYQHDAEPLPNTGRQPPAGSPSLGLRAGFQPATPPYGVVSPPHDYNQSSPIFTSDNVFQRHGMQITPQKEIEDIQDTSSEDAKSNAVESPSIYLPRVQTYDPAMRPPRFRESLLLETFHTQNAQLNTLSDLISQIPLPESPNFETSQSPAVVATMAKESGITSTAREGTPWNADEENQLQELLNRRFIGMSNQEKLAMFSGPHTTVASQNPQESKGTKRY